MRNQRTQSTGRFTEQWVTALMASGLDPGAKVAGYGVSQYADWHTGENARPSMATLAGSIGMTRESSARAVSRLTAAGWLTTTGHAPRGVVVHALTVPASCDVGVTAEGLPVVTSTSQVMPASCDADVTAEGLPVVASTRSVVTPASQVPVTPASHNLLITSSERSEEEEEEEAAGGGLRYATPAPDGVVDGEASARAPDTVRIARQIIQAVTEGDGAPKAWRGAPLDVHTVALAVVPLVRSGWRVEDLCAHARTVGRPRSAPSGLLAAHMRRLVDEDPETWRRHSGPPQTLRERLDAIRATHDQDVARRLPDRWVDPWWAKYEDAPSERLYVGGRLNKAKSVTDVLAALQAAEDAGWAPLDLLDPPEGWEIDEPPCHCPGCRSYVSHALQGAHGLIWACPAHTGAWAQLDTDRVPCQTCGHATHVAAQCEAYWLAEGLPS